MSISTSEGPAERPIRGLSFSTYAKFSGFLTPSLPLVRISRNLSVLSYAEISNFFNPPPPLSAYVLNGSPLTTHTNPRKPTQFLRNQRNYCIAANLLVRQFCTRKRDEHGRRNWVHLIRIAHNKLGDTLRNWTLTFSFSHYSTNREQRILRYRHTGKGATKSIGNWGSVCQLISAPFPFSSSIP